MTVFPGTHTKPCLLITAPTICAPQLSVEITAAAVMSYACVLKQCRRPKQCFPIINSPSTLNEREPRDR
jgi:hypothetical protein